MSEVRIVIEVSGGNVDCVYADPLDGAEVCIIDRDKLGEAGEPSVYVEATQRFDVIDVWERRAVEAAFVGACPYCHQSLPHEE